MVGRKYGFGLVSFFKEYISAGPTADATPSGASKAYFCSELVATAYMFMGLLPPRPAASHYFPVHFSADKTLNWRPGVGLEQEYLIDFAL